MGLIPKAPLRLYDVVEEKKRQSAKLSSDAQTALALERELSKAPPKPTEPVFPIEEKEFGFVPGVKEPGRQRSVPIPVAKVTEAEPIPIEERTLAAMRDEDYIQTQIKMLEERRDRDSVVYYESGPFVGQAKERNPEVVAKYNKQLDALYKRLDELRLEKAGISLPKPPSIYSQVVRAGGDILPGAGKEAVNVLRNQRLLESLPEQNPENIAQALGGALVPRAPQIGIPGQEPPGFFEVAMALSPLTIAPAAAGGVSGAITRATIRNLAKEAGLLEADAPVLVAVVGEKLKAARLKRPAEIEKISEVTGEQIKEMQQINPALTWVEKQKARLHILRGRKKAPELDPLYRGPETEEFLAASLQEGKFNTRVVTEDFRRILEKEGFTPEHIASRTPQELLEDLALNEAMRSTVGPTNKITATEFTALHQMIEDSYDLALRKGVYEFNLLRAHDSLDLLLQTGKLPAEAELGTLEAVFGLRFVSQITGQSALGKQAYNAFLEVIGVPRIIMTSYDMSAPLRQGIILGISHPKEVPAAFGAMVRSWFDEKYAADRLLAIRSMPEYPLMKRAKLAVLDWVPTEGRKLTNAEELFRDSATIQRLPGIKASQRSFTVYLDKLRADIFANTLRRWVKGGKAATADEVDGLATWINWASGRGPLPAGRLTEGMNVAFFAPRLFTSRLLTPFAPFLIKGRRARLQAAQDFAEFMGVGAAGLALMKATGVADVELDPRSSDFGKVRVGNARFDFWGGLQPIVRYTAQMVTSQRKTAGGRIQKVDRREPFLKFVQSKLSPPAGLAMTAFTGQTTVGEPFTLSAITRNYLAPLTVGDVLDAIETAEGNFYSVPLAAGLGFLGAGVTSYKDSKSIRDKVAAQLYAGKKSLDTGEVYPKGIEFDKLTPNERDRVDQSPEAQEWFAKIEERSALADRATIRDAQKVYRDLAIYYERKIQDAIAKDIKGAALRQVISGVKQARYDSARALFDDFRDELVTQKDGLSLVDNLRDQYWAMPLTEDEFGLPIFSERDTAREKVLRFADQYGIAREAITKRARRFTSDAVEGAVLDLEYAQETLKSYRETYKSFLSPDNQIVYEQYLRLQSMGDYTTTNSYRKSFPIVRAWESHADKLRERMRRTDPQIEAALQKWYGVKPIAMQQTATPTAPVSFTPLRPSTRRSRRTRRVAK